MKNLDFLEQLMKKVKVLNFDESNGVLKLSLFTVQDVISLSVRKSHLLYSYTEKSPFHNYLECNRDYDYTVIRFTPYDFASVFGNLFDDLIQNSTKTDMFKKILEQNGGDKISTVKFIDEFDEEIHVWGEVELL